jgi:hypothetical protein
MAAWRGSAAKAVYAAKPRFRDCRSRAARASATSEESRAVNGAAVRLAEVIPLSDRRAG